MEWLFAFAGFGLIALLHHVHTSRRRPPQAPEPPARFSVSDPYVSEPRAQRGRSGPLPPLARPDKTDVYVRLDALPLAEKVELAGGEFDARVALVGESHHQGRLRQLDAGRLARDEASTFTAWVIPEEANPHDKLAVLVVAPEVGPIGHMSREDARRYRPVMKLLAKHHLVASCPARLFGGHSEAPSIGVWLQLLGPTRTLKAVKTHITVNGPQP